MIPTLEEILRMEEEMGIPLAQGLGRRVKKVGDFVVKRAINKRGYAESKKEYNISKKLDSKYQKYIAPVYYYVEEEGVIVMPYAHELTQDEYIQEITRSKDFKNLHKELVMRFDIDDLDLYYYFNYGKLNGETVLIDYGHVLDFGGDIYEY